MLYGIGDNVSAFHFLYKIEHMAVAEKSCVVYLDKGIACKGDSVALIFGGRGSAACVLLIIVSFILTACKAKD